MSWLDAAHGSLRGRLVLSLTAGILAVMTVSFFALHLLIREGLYRHLDRELELRMRAVAEYAAAHPGQESIAEFMPRFRTRSHQDFFQVWDGRNRTLVRSDSSAGQDMPRLEAVAGSPTYYDLELPDGHRGRAVAQVFDLPPGDARDALTVVAAEETRSLEQLEHQVHYMLLFVAVVTVAAALVIAVYSVQQGLRPVRGLVDSLEAVELDDPNARIEAGPLPAELRPVAGAFSQLLDRLLQALARERRYARNVAHELRNPLAEMRLLADVGSASLNADACQAALRDIGSVAAEMEQIIDALMALTRYEAGIESPQPEPVDLAAELRREIQKKARAVSQRGMAIRLDLPDEVWVHTDSALTHRLLANLMGNAVSHAPQGAAVHVTLSSSGDLSFANPAPHLASKDVPRLRERFYHIGDGRQNGAHAGLGLSLADAIARILGLTLRLTLREDGWLVAEVRGFRALTPATEAHEVAPPS